MEIGLKEKFLLLAIDDKKGGREKGQYFFEAGFIACILLEMIIDETLELRDGKLHLHRMGRPQDPVYRDVVNRLLPKKKDKSLKFWISNLRGRAARYRKDVLKNLIRGNILRKEAHRFLGIRYYRYPTLNPNPENTFRRELLSALANPREISESDLALLAILDAAKFLPILLPDKKARKQASESIKQICKGSDFGKAVGEAVQEMITAMVATVVIAGAVH